MTTTETPIRSVGGWFHLLPFGEFEHPESDRIQVIDRPAVENIVTRFRREQQRPNSGGLLVDQDHFSYDLNQATTARGWLKDMEIRPDGLWVLIELTDIGESEIKNRRYKFLSAVFLPGDLESLGGNRVRPRRLDSAGFTNRPRMKELSPMVNRNDAPTRPAGGTIDLPDPDPELPNIAASVLYALANREPGRDYSERMFSVQTRYPLLNRAAGHEKIYSNRSYDAHFALTERDRQMVEAGARDLREHFRKQDYANAAFNTDLPLYRTPNQLHEYAGRVMDGLRQREELTREAAFERLEEVHPLLFINLCLNPLDGKTVTRMEPRY